MQPPAALSTGIETDRIGEGSSAPDLVHVQYKGEMLNAGRICSK